MIVATTIYNQLGGSKFVTMFGVKKGTLVTGQKSLQFQIPRNQSKASHIRIELNGNDLYDISFIKIQKFVPVTVIAHKDVYAEDMVKLLETETGFYASL